MQRERSPRLELIPNFLPPAELERLRGRLDAERGEEDAAGERLELPAIGDPQLLGLLLRLEGQVGMRSAVPPTFRLRRYREGQGHPPHLDAYRTEEAELCCTALLYLQAPTEGGETDFPAADLRVAPQPGQLLLFWTLDGEQIDPASRHASLPVRAGCKEVLAYFFYRPRKRLVLVVERGIETEALARSAEVRGLALRCVEAERGPEGLELRPGDLLYNMGASAESVRVEQQLWRSGLRSLHLDPDGPFFGYRNGQLLMARHGVPVPATLAAPSRASSPELPELVRRLGGFPLVLKLPGGSGGVGVVQVDSLPALRSLLDLCLAEGRSPQLQALVSGRVWRVVIIDQRPFCAYLNPLRSGDLRSAASTRREDYHLPLPAPVAEAAVAAVRALRLRCAGVDVIEHESGRPFVLEANFPFYFGHAQEMGHDVAGALVDLMLAQPSG